MRKHGKTSAPSDAALPLAPARADYRTWIIAAALIAAVLAAYAPSLKGEFLWDDNDYISQNAVLQSPNALSSIWLHPKANPQYYPIVFTSFLIEHQLWGNWTLPYHLANILLHIINAMLVWWLLARLKVPGAALAAAIFALHPVNVESVAWICERKNVLSMLFFLLSAGAYLRFAWDGPAAEWPRRIYYALSLVLFAAAMLSKTAVVFLPAALALLLWWRKGRLGVADLLPLVPMLAMAVAGGIMTMHVEGNLDMQGTAPAEIDFPAKVVIAGQAVWFYLGKLLWPHPLVPLYPGWNASNFAAWDYLAPVAVVAAVAMLWAFRRRLGRAPLTAALFFLAALAPVLGFIWLAFLNHSRVADHFLYIACLGLIVPAAAAAAWAFQRARRRHVALKVTLAAMLLTALGLVTYRQAGIYQSIESFFGHTVAYNPYSAVSHVNLGVALRQRALSSGEASKPDARLMEQALRELQEAVRLDPRIGRANLFIGIMYDQAGNKQAASDYYRRELDMYPNRDGALISLVTLLLDTGRASDALPLMSGYFTRTSRPAACFRMLGRALSQRGMHELAVMPFAEGIKYERNYLPGYHELAQVFMAGARAWEAQAASLRAAGKTDEAALAARRAWDRFDAAGEVCLEATRLEPNDASVYYYLGYTQSRCGRYPNAVEAYRRSVELARSPETLNDLAYLLATTPDANVRNAGEALKLVKSAMGNQENALMLDTMAAAYAAAGQFDQARQTQKRAIELIQKGPQESLIPTMQHRLKSYEANEAIVESAVLVVIPQPATAPATAPAVP